MPEQSVPSDSLDAIFTADDDQATTEARIDGKALVRFHSELVAGGLSDDLIADCCRTWLESYLDGQPCAVDE